MALLYLTVACHIGNHSSSPQHLAQTSLIFCPPAPSGLLSLLHTAYKSRSPYLPCPICFPSNSGLHSVIELHAGGIEPFLRPVPPLLLIYRTIPLFSFLLPPAVPFLHAFRLVLRRHRC